MKKFIKSHRLLTGLLSILISVFLVSIVAYASTTIGTNINTGGTLDVTGLATFDHATTTSATTTAYLYVGEDITEPAGWDFSGGDLIVSGLAYFHTKATTTTAFAVGAGTIDHLDMAGGDLYVLDDVEIDGLATSTEGFYSMGTLQIGGDGLIRGKATTTTAFAVGAGTIGSLDMDDGDLYVQDDVEIGGWASTTSALNTQGTGHIGGDFTVDGEITSVGSTTASIINMTTVKFTPSATPTSAVTGECFVDSTDNQLNCYDGTDWQHAW